MAKKTENVRLLLHSKDQSSRPCWQTKARGHCFLCTILQIILFLFFFIVLLFIAFEVSDIEKDIKRKGKGISNDPLPNNTIPGTALCKSVNAENMSLVALGYLTGIREKSTMEAQNQIYYLTDRYFTDQEACAIEAALRLFQDKSIFIIEIGNVTVNHTGTNYIPYLRQHYTNLNEIKSTAEKFFKGSPFQNHIKSIDNFALFAAKVLLVWQFGGTVLDPNFLLLTRRLYDQNEGFCEVDKDLLFCPNQCSAFVYQVVKTVLDLVGSSGEGVHNMTQDAVKDIVERIVDKSVSDYCGDEQAIHIGCIGINRLKEEHICEDLYQDCQYLRVQEWKTKNPKWKTIVQKFCPKIVSKLQYDSQDPFIT